MNTENYIPVVPGIAGSQKYLQEYLGMPYAMGCRADPGTTDGWFDYVEVWKGDGVWEVDKGSPYAGSQG